MTARLFMTAVIFGLMWAEARVSWAHERRLRDEGAVAPPGDVYLPMAVLYPLAFLAMGVEGAWRAAATGTSMLSGAGPAWALSGAVLFVASKALKYWAIHALGYRWSFRVFIVPGLPLVRTGPYRYVAHPNYIGVVGELVGAAMMMGANVSGPIAIVAFGVVLWARLRFETRVLATAGRGVQA